MALGYMKPVSYQSPMNDYNMTGIKIELPSYDYSGCSTSPTINFLHKMEESKHDFLKHKSVLREEEPPQLTSWITKHPQSWTQKEVLDWVFFVVEQEHLDGSKVQGEAYKDFTGAYLCSMNESDFQKADPGYGSKMYQTFRNLVNNFLIEEPKPATDIRCLDTFNFSNNEAFTTTNKNIGIPDNIPAKSLLDSDEEISGNSRNNSVIDDIFVYKTDNDTKVNLPNLGTYPISIDLDFPSSTTAQGFLASASRLTTAASFTSPPLSSSDICLPQISSLSPNMPSSIASTRSSSSSSPASLPSSFAPCSCPMIRPHHGRFHAPRSSSSSCSSSVSHGPSHSSPRRPPATLSVPSASLSSTSSSPHSYTNDPGYGSDDSVPEISFMPPYQPTSGPCDDVEMRDRAAYHDDVIVDLGRNKNKDGKRNRGNTTKKGNHLWEFIKDRLRDPETNPKLLKWENKEAGVFRFVQSEAIAKLWGEKKNNPMMTYEKLSRAMRFCRSAGYFESVPRTGQYPKKLCFKFGAKAHGWEN